MRLSLKKIFLKTIGRIIPSDSFSQRFPVSIKGVCFIDDKVILLKNERKEWDLPGGKLKKKESIKSCLKREIKEELNIQVQVENLIAASNINIMNTIEVLVIVYQCTTQASLQELKISQENFDLGAFSVEDVPMLSLPLIYQQAIQTSFIRRSVNKS